MLAVVNRKRFKFKIVFCAFCHLAMQHPPISTNELRDYYSAGYNLQNYHDDLLRTFKTMGPISECRFEFICSHRNGVPPTYFEIGPGAGTLMCLFKDRGSRVYGVEPDEAAVRWLRIHQGVHVETGFFEEFAVGGEDPQAPRNYSLVVLSHVLEHAPDPVSFLQKAKDLVEKPQGRLYVEVPNVYRPYSDGLFWEDHCDIGHVYYYSPRTLQMILEKAGFDIVAMDTNKFAPYFPIFCMAKPSSGSPSPPAAPKQTPDDIAKIQKCWRRFRVKHHWYYTPRRKMGQWLRKVWSK